MWAHLPLWYWTPRATKQPSSSAASSRETAAKTSSNWVCEPKKSLVLFRNPTWGTQRNSELASCRWGSKITEVLPKGEDTGSFQSHGAKTLKGLTLGTGAMRRSELSPEPVLCNVMADNRLTLVLAQRPEMKLRWGQVTLRGSPELLGLPGVMSGLGPGEKGRTPLPTSTASGEAPPSTGVSGASSSRSVVRLYSTICQTVGGANRGQAERALCPRPCPSAPGLAGPPPVRREDPLSPAGLSGLGPLRPAPRPARSPFSASPSPCRRLLPPRPQPLQPVLSPEPPLTLPPPPSSCSATFMVE